MAVFFYIFLSHCERSLTKHSISNCHSSYLLYIKRMGLFRACFMSLVGVLRIVSVSTCTYEVLLNLLIIMPWRDKMGLYFNTMHING